MTLQKTCLFIKSGQKANVSGYYVYVTHVNPDEYQDCFITDRAKAGLYISKGSIMPDTGSCNHQIEWKLIQ